MLSTVAISWMVFQLSVTGSLGSCATNESNLIKDLLKNYDKDARPVKNQSDAVRVELQMIYNELKEIEEPKQQMTSITRFKISWKDISLQWNKEKYGGVKSIHLHPTRIWVPDLTLYNSVHKDGGNIYSSPTKVLVGYTGNVTWLTYAMLKSTCKLDIADFPVDNQRCSLKIGSWTLTSDELDLQLVDDKQPDLGQYNENTEWDLMSAKATIRTATYPCCPHVNYTDITFVLHFKRKAWFYIVTIVLPCIILSLLASISFLFPAGSGERVSLVISVLLGLTVFMLIINEETPVSSDSTPMLTLYFNIICCGTFVILLATAFILQIHHGSKKERVSRLLGKTRDLIAFVLGMKLKQKTQYLTKGKGVEARLLDDDHRLSWSGSTILDSGAAKKRYMTDIMLMRKLQNLATSMADSASSEKAQSEWQYTARVFDRFFLVMFLLFFLGLNMYIIIFLNT